MGVYLTYSYDNTKRSRMIDNLTLRLRRDEEQIKKINVFGQVGVATGLAGKNYFKKYCYMRLL